MPSLIPNRQARIGRYVALSLGFCLLVVVLKAVVTWLCETYFYSLPWLGGLLSSLEIVEVTNGLLFAGLGFGLGAAAVYYLPAAWHLVPRLAPLVVALPLIFGTTALTRHAMWVQRVARQAGVSRATAQKATSAFLQQETGNAGSWGFYCYTARGEQLPTQLSSLEPLLPEEKALLQGELGRYQDGAGALLVFVFNQIGWLLRCGYLVFTALMGLVYFYKGQRWASQRQQKS
jgi:hypothetical protein